MSKSVIRFSNMFSKPQNIKVRLVEKGSINLRNVVLIFIMRNNWETIGKRYKAMGEINVELSECGFFSVFEELVKYEIRLSESDNLDDYNSSEKRRHILC